MNIKQKILLSFGLLLVSLVIFVALAMGLTWITSQSFKELAQGQTPLLQSISVLKQKSDTMVFLGSQATTSNSTYSLETLRDQLQDAADEIERIYPQIDASGISRESLRQFSQNLALLEESSFNVIQQRSLYLQNAESIRNTQALLDRLCRSEVEEDVCYFWPQIAVLIATPTNRHRDELSAMINAISIKQEHIQRLQQVKAALDENQILSNKIAALSYLMQQKSVESNLTLNDFYSQTQNKVLQLSQTTQKRLEQLIITLVIAGIFGLALLAFAYRVIQKRIIDRLSNLQDHLNAWVEHKSPLPQPKGQDEMTHIESFIGQFLEQIHQQQKRIEELSVTDKLTGIYNRTYTDQELNKAILQAQRSKTPLSLIFMDVDHFKQVNDRYGHLVGDEVLSQIAKLVKHRIRQTDTFGRWGGEEFLIICLDTPLEGAKALAEDIRMDIAKHDFPEVHRVTASFGVTLYEKGQSTSHFMQQADLTLYHSKLHGRNCVTSSLNIPAGILQ